MVPPWDSLQHQNTKLSEALSDIHAIEVPPPPSYCAMLAATESFHTYEADDDEDDDVLPVPASITIKVDASVHIQGQGTTIMLPAANTSSGQPRTSKSEHGRAATLPGTILAALRDAGMVGESDEKQRPLGLQVNASVNIKGGQNVIYAGIPGIALDNGEQVELPQAILSSPDESKKRKAESV